MDLASAPILPEDALPTAPLEGWSDGLHPLSTPQTTRPAFLTAWQDLGARSTEPNPFFEPWFCAPSFAHLGKSARITAYAFVQDQRLCGFLPLARSASYYGYPVPHCSTWLHSNAFLGCPLIATGHEAAFWSALLETLDTRIGSSVLLHLPQIPVGSAASDALFAVLQADARPHAIVQQEERAMLASDLSPEDYLAQSMSAKKRKELRRQHKRLCEDGALTVDRIEGEAGLDRWVQEFLSIEHAGWKGAEGSALACKDQTASFFAETLQGAARAEKLERLSLRVDGRAVAMLANFLTPPGVFSFKTAFDERYAKFSPGLLLQLENLSLLERNDIDWADSCAAEGHSMIERLWREKRALQSVNIAIGGGLRRTLFKQLMRREMRGQNDNEARCS